MTEITVGAETIGPKEAKALLDTNDNNRNLRYGLVAKLRRDVLAGRWILNGETIKISDKGKLLDGQHRLMAVVQADRPITTMVVRGLPDTISDTIDSGAARTFGDALRLHGEDHYYTLAAVSRVAWLIENYGKPLSGGNANPTFGELNAYLDANPALRESAAMAVASTRVPLGLPGSMTGAIYFHMRKIDPELATEFWRQLVKNDAKRGSAVWVLREQLVRDMANPHRMSVPYRAALIIKAWNFWLEAKEPSYISWKPLEDFPRLRAPRTKAEVA